MAILSLITGILGAVSLQQWIALFLVLVVSSLLYLMREYGKWEAVGIPGPAKRPLPLFGNDLDMYTGKIDFIQHTKNLHNDNKDKR